MEIDRYACGMTQLSKRRSWVELDRCTCDTTQPTERRSWVELDRYACGTTQLSERRSRVELDRYACGITQPMERRSWMSDWTLRQGRLTPQICYSAQEWFAVVFEKICSFRVVINTSMMIVP